MKNRLAALIAERSIELGRKVEVREVAEATGISRTTLHSYINQKVSRFDGDTLENLCKYFGVQVDKVIYVTPDPTLPKSSTQQGNQG